MTILQPGTVVSFSVSEGYPSIVRSYCGVITRWNGGSYDIRVGNKTFFYIPENSVVLGS